MKLLGVLTWIALSTIGSALIYSSAFRLMWSWLLATEYGAGPSMRAWFGITSILTMIVSIATAQSSTKDDRSVDALMKAATLAMLSRWAGCWAGVGLIYVTSLVLGWVP